MVLLIPFHAIKLSLIAGRDERGIHPFIMPCEYVRGIIYALVMPCTE